MIICGYKDKYLECSYIFYWFSKVAIVGFPLWHMASPAMGIWAGLQYQT